MQQLGQFHVVVSVVARQESPGLGRVKTTQSNKEAHPTPPQVLLLVSCALLQGRGSSRGQRVSSHSKRIKSFWFLNIASQ